MRFRSDRVKRGSRKLSNPCSVAFPRQVDGLGHTGFEPRLVSEMDQLTYSLSITMLADSSRSGFLAVVSVLHRRGVRVLEAELRRAIGDVQSMTVTLALSRTRMDTLAKSLVREIDVLSADFVELFDFRHATETPCAPDLFTVGSSS